MSSTKQGPNRRSVLKVAAWTAPAIVVATAAPAMAASGPADLRVTIGSAVRSNGAKSIAIVSTIQNVNTWDSVGQSHTVSVTLASAAEWSSPTASAIGYAVTPVITTGATRSWLFTSGTAIPGLSNTTNFTVNIVVGGNGNVSAGSTSVTVNPSLSQTLNSSSKTLT